MSSTTKSTVRALNKAAVGIGSLVTVRQLLEDHLFSDILRESESGAISGEIWTTLLDLYERLRSEDIPTGDLAQYVDRLLKSPDLMALDPLGVLTYKLRAILMRDSIDYAAAVELLQLPWEVAAKSVSAPSARSLRDFHSQLAAFSHEVEDGFVDARMNDIQLTRDGAELVKSLSTELQSNTPQ